MSVVVDDGALRDLAGHGTDLRSKIYGLGYEDSALHHANVDTDRKGSNDVWLAQEGSPCPF